ncbi:YafY family protein [Solwaraspora sp. WMMD406]|uniref:helix-turn-helix transcriptional regulator n=1 Tax=Solwaraspora sp. WMMD406 TaxID=3016095 RepID=UPI002416F2A3|nr:YafY family protein [Solwaraspora sp. WMMD406]MDG4766219.1 YafY family protein [Solwaraspora sp. WMMD406]
MSAPRSAGSRTSADRLARLLNLVPYLLARPGVSIAQAADDLGTTVRQLREDLELLWVCGLPGYGPGDLIDMAFDGDRVTITYDAGIDRPLRLTPDEALALVVALRMLAETPGLSGRDAVERALAKIEDAAGELAGAPVAVRLAGDVGRLDRLRTVTQSGRAVRITYYTAARDETTERTVDPIRVLMIGGRGYLEAWCRRAEAVRLFRADRIDELVELDESAAAPPRARRPEPRDGAFQPTSDLPLVTVRVGRGGRWITEYYPCEEIRDEPSGEWLVTMRVTDLAWARRFVLGLGSEVTVVAPAELVAQVHAAATAALQAYALPAGSPPAGGPADG